MTCEKKVISPRYHLMGLCYPFDSIGLMQALEQKYQRKEVFEVYGSL
jgi:hypothetical protein